MRESAVPLRSYSVYVSESLPRPPYWASAAAAAAVLQHGGPGSGGDWGGTAGSVWLMKLLLVLLLLLLLGALHWSDRSFWAGACREEVHGVPPALRVALVVVAVAQAWLKLLPQEAHSHLQDVGFLQLGVGLLLVELFLQNDFELIDAAVDAISAHFLHNRFSQLVKETVTGKLKFSNKQSGMCTVVADIKQDILPVLTLMLSLSDILIWWGEE